MYTRSQPVASSLPPGEAVAVHLRDHGLGEIPDAHPALGDVTRPRALAARRVVRHLLAFVAAAEVVARRERRAGAADDRDRHRRVLVVGAQRVEDRPAQRMHEAVALLGPIHRDAAHTRRRLVYQDHVVGHWMTPSLIPLGYFFTRCACSRSSCGRAARRRRRLRRAARGCPTRRSGPRRTRARGRRARPSRGGGRC